MVKQKIKKEPETLTDTKDSGEDPRDKKAVYGSHKVTSGGLTFYMDGYLQSNLTTLKGSVTKDDYDCVFVVDGYERYGKSTLAQQVCKFFDPTFNIDRICFTAKEFMDAVSKAEKFQAILYDEAITGLTARQTMSVINMALVKMMAQVGQKNLFIGVVIPTFFDLDKYAGLWRSMFLLHVYVSEGLQRGFFSFYNRYKKKFLYMSGKKFYSYKVSPNFTGRFTKFSVVDDKEYRARKLKALTRRASEIGAHEERYKRHRDALIYAMFTNENISLESISRYLTHYLDIPFDRRYVEIIIREFEKGLKLRKQLKGG